MPFVKPEPDENNIEKIECSNPIISQVIDKNIGRYKMTYTCPTKPTDDGGKNGDDDNGEVDISTIDDVTHLIIINGVLKVIKLILHR